VLLLIFAAVPVILYEQFRAADQDRQELLLTHHPPRRHRRQSLPWGGVGARRHPPYFQARRGAGAVSVRDRTSLKLLFAPRPPRDGGFFYVASAPPVPRPALDIGAII